MYQICYVGPTVAHMHRTEKLHTLSFELIQGLELVAKSLLDEFFI